MSGIYIHIPFCKQACSYCDFYFVTRAGMRDEYVDSLIEEIEAYRDTKFSSEPVETVYFGGGTPSLLPPGQVGRIMERLHSVFPIEAKEITLEMNPDDVNREFLDNLLSAGITRASMGVQSFQPELLEFMNRAHDREEAIKCLELLADSGFEVFTVDIIYGNPGQSLDELSSDLELLMGFDPPHVSAYSLTIEPKTRLGKQVEMGRISPPDDEKVASHFDLVADRLQEAGILQYEVSNFSKPGMEAVHNSSYWKHENYLGLGPAAHSFWWHEQPQRWENPADIKQYLSQEPVNGQRETLSMLQLAEERMMMGLRTRKGISLEVMKKRYNYQFNEHQKEYMRKKAEEGKASLNKDSFTLTREGLKIADAIILDIVTI